MKHARRHSSRRHKRGSLARVLDRVVRGALISGVACGARVEGEGATEQLELGEPLAPAGLSGDWGSGEGLEPAAASGIPLEAVCLPEGQSRLSRLALAEDVEFIALRTRYVESNDPGKQVDAHGDGCAGAPDPGACQSALSQLWPSADSEWLACGQAGCRAYALVTSRGGQLQLHQSHASIRLLLGDIDAPMDAMLWAEAHGYTPRCQRDDLFGIPPLALSRLTRGYRLETHELVESCPMRFERVVFDIAADGSIVEVVREDFPTQVSACVGRRPAGLANLDAGPTSTSATGARAELGRFFARVAMLEVAAVTAFGALEAELRALGAPLALRRAARRAARDEVRHGRIIGGWARAFGGEPAAPVLLPAPRRSRFELARENLVEGCVRETFGAAVARYQASRAALPSLRSDLARIAADERRHAELSWRVHAWLWPRLDPNERRALEACRVEAIAELRQELRAPVPRELQQVAGVPGSAQALALLDALEQELWAGCQRAA